MSALDRLGDAVRAARFANRADLDDMRSAMRGLRARLDEVADLLDELQYEAAPAGMSRAEWQEFVFDDLAAALEEVRPAVADACHAALLVGTS